MPVTEGLRVLTDSDLVREHRQVDARAHAAQPPGGLRHLRQGRRMHAAGLPLQVQRPAVGVARRRRCARPSITRCRSASCSTTSAASCARAASASRARSRSRTRSASRSAAITRWCAPPRTARSRTTPYSDNVVDLCPVGALLSRSFLHRARVWYLEPTPSVCPGCARGCTVDLWHRKPEWKLNALDPRARTPHRARDAARQSGGQRAVDLQQGTRPREDLRAAARDCRRWSAGTPVDARRGDRRRARAHRRREASRGARVELGQQRGARGLRRARSASASRAS